MHQLKRLIHEIHRRSLWQVLGVFLAASWAVVEAVDFLTEQVGLPDWTPVMALVLLLLGLPVVLATAFVQEGMPGQDGIPQGGTASPDASGRAAADAATDAPPENLAAGTGSLDRPSTRPSATRRLFTWRNAFLGGMGAFTLLGMSLVAYFVMWTTGIGPAGNLVAQGVIEDGERVVLATFADDTGEGLGEVVTEALRVDLAEAEVLQLVEPVELEPVLRRMQLDPSATTLSGEVASEVALRDGIGAVLDGEVARAGTGYLITAALREGGTGRSLASFRVTADGPEEVIPAIDQLSQDIREKSGESLRRIRSGVELERVTTASLEALRLFTQAEEAVYRGDQRRALELLDEAVEVDPEFAMAWRRMGALLNNTGLDPERHDYAATQAYQHRDRLSERERYLTEAYYYGQIERSPEQTVAAYQNVLRIAPDDPSALNNLANEYVAIADFQRARELYRRAVDGPGRSPVAFGNLVRVHISTGDYERAVAVFEEYTAAYPDDVSALEYGFYAHLGRGDIGQAEELVVPLTDDPALPIFVRVRSLQALGQAAYWRGRLDEGRRHHEAAERVAGEVSPAYRLDAIVRTSEMEALIGDPAWAVAHLGEARESGLWDDVSPDARNWVGVVLLYLDVGDVDEATRILESWEGSGVELPEWHRLTRIVMDAALGAEPDPLGALDELETERGCAASCYPAWEVVAAQAGELTTEEIRAQEALLERGLPNLPLNTLYRLPAILGLGSLYEEVGDTAAALDAHRRVVELWAEADDRGQERVNEARARIQALGG